MKNSDLATVTSSKEVFAIQRAHVQFLPQARAAEEPLQDEVISSYEATVGAKTKNKFSQINTTHGSWLRPVAGSPDRGLWLLRSSADRHRGWDRLQKFAPEDGLILDPPSNKMSEKLKRFCDLAGSLFLLTLALPLFPLLSLAVKLDSPGPVFFRHDRVGLYGKHFVLWKFRSMKVDVSQYSNSPRSAADVRLTRVGRLIRRLSLDELPQLLNVVKGDMSLVGPRPEMPFLVEQFHQACSERLTVRPGITGLWQISPSRASQIHENLQYDLHYIRNRNLVLDFVILLRTIAAVIHGVGAV